jgi:hypothetical protein
LRPLFPDSFDRSRDVKLSSLEPTIEFDPIFRRLLLIKFLKSSPQPSRPTTPRLANNVVSHGRCPVPWILA